MMTLMLDENLEMLPFNEDKNFFHENLLEFKVLGSIPSDNFLLPRRTQVPHNNVRSRIEDPASNPTPVTTYSCATSSLFRSPDAGKKAGQIFKVKIDFPPSVEGLVRRNLMPQLLFSGIFSLVNLNDNTSAVEMSNS